MVKHYIGEKINMLTIIDECKEKDKYGNKKWICQCDCGNKKILSSNNIRNYISCGCYKNSLITKHNKSKTKIYYTYQRMKNRCYRKNYPHYENYGGRGIKMCNEWLGENGFINFYNWAIKNGYKEKLSIDRINVNGNYEPSNCRWITMFEQASNKRNNIFYTINGKTMTQTQWCKYYNIPRTNVRRRIDIGWSVLDAYTKPIRKKG